MDLSALHKGFILWSVFGVAVAMAIPLEWYDWLFHGPRWRRVLSLFFMGPIMWIGIWITVTVDRVNDEI